MRWLSILGLVQLLSVLSIALPSTPQPSPDGSNALALRDTAESKTLALDIRAPGDLDPYIVSDHSTRERSLQPREVPTFVGMFMFYAYSPLAQLAGWALRSGSPWVGYTLMASILPGAFMLGTYSIAWTYHLWSNLLYDIQEDRLTRNNKMRKLKLEEGQLAIQEIQQNAEMKRVAQEAENSIQKMHRDEEQEAKKWEWEKEDRPTALNQKLFDAKTAEYNFEILTSKTSATFMIANLQKEAQIHEELDELAKEAQKLWDEADELKELKEKWKKYEAIQGIEEKRLAFLKDAKEKSQANEKENERLLEAIGGEDKAAEASLLAIVAENLKDDPVFSMPGAFPDRRRRRNHFNRPPIMLHEQTDSCDTEHCHRLWYTRHRTANNKRSASGRSSSHHPWGDIIHDFHVTPVDFYFTDAGTLQRRDPTDEEEFSAFEDCEEEVTFGEGDQRTTFYSRILSQYGGDAASLDLFASIPPEDFIKAMRKDLDKIPTEEIDGHEYSRVLGVGMNCGKIDFDEQDNPAAKNARAVKNETAVGNPPAVWFAYTLSNTTEYSHKDPKELMTLCENYFKK